MAAQYVSTFFERFERADTDLLFYKKEDLEWVIWPSNDDAGVTGPKPGAEPISFTMFRR